MTNKTLGRMASILGYVSPGEKLDPTPVELPAGTRKHKSISDEIQEQIAIQIAMKQAKEGTDLQTIGEIRNELLDLDEDQEPEFFSQYEYISMADEFEPHEMEAPDGGRENETNESGEAGESPSDQEENRDN